MMPPADDMGPAELLARIGQALWGEDWRPSLAAMLDVRERAVANWLNGRNVIPSGVWDEVQAEMQKRSARLQHLLREVSKLPREAA